MRITLRRPVNRVAVFILMRKKIANRYDPLNLRQCFLGESVKIALLRIGRFLYNAPVSFAMCKERNFLDP